MKKIIFVTILLLSLVMCVSISKEIDLAKPKKIIKGAKVEQELQVKHIASDEYFKKMKFKILADEGIRDISIVKIGYDVDGFAKKGENIWEARVLTLNGELRAIIWVHPNTGKVYFVTGAWK
ncbi:MAG: hypothetical protein Q7K21_08015 [Elusimicrobiota bacterium]|nr:hypothetical protein [Elusimicrobiota bacterium]